MGLKIMAELGLDGSGFESGIAKAEGRVHGMLEGLKGFVLASVGIGAVEMMLHKTVKTAEDLINTSKRLGVAPDMLQVLGKSAQEAGSSLEDVAHAIEKIDEAREKSLMGGNEGKEQRRAFTSLGVSPEQLRSMTGSQLLMGPMANAAKTLSPEQAGIAFREVIGKGFGTMIPVLQTDFAELEKKMKDVGAIMDTDTAVKLKYLGDQLSIISEMIIPRLGQSLISLIEVIIKSVAGINEAFVYLRALRNANNFQVTRSAMDAMSAFFKIGPGAAIGTLIAGVTSKQPGKDSPLEQAHDAALAKSKEWTAWLAKLQSRFDASSNRLNNPIPPDLGKPQLGMMLGKNELISHGDALSKTGNFLGGLNVSTVEKQKVNLLQQIANNTARDRIKATNAAASVGAHIGSMVMIPITQWPQ